MSSKLRELTEILDGLCGYYNRDALNPMAVKIYAMALEKYSIESIKQAVRIHISDTEHGQYFPKASDFIRNIEGGALTPEQIIGMARNKSCPLGVLARIKIGTRDLDSQDSFYLRQRAQEVLLVLPEWRERAAEGNYNDHEISMMVKHGVEPTAPFFEGLAPPENQDKLLARVAYVTGTPRHAELMELPYQPEEHAEQAPESVLRLASDKRA